MASMRERKGSIAWMAQNPVAANLLMLVLLVGGLLASLRVRQEVFPEFKLDIISIQIPYPGASPSEVEQGIVLAVEEAVRGIDGIKRVTASATEGMGSVATELMIDADPNEVLSDVKTAVDRITSLPEEAERPIVSVMSNRREVISVILYGAQSHAVLRELADGARDELLLDPEITHVDLVGAPAREIVIEVPQSQLRTYGLTLETIAGKVAQTALELPGGAVKTAAGEVLLRTSERRSEGREFADIPVVTGSSGTEVVLGDIADVRDDFAETDESAAYNGQPAVMLKIFRTGEQTPIEVAEAVKRHVEAMGATLPAGVAATTWLDWSEIYAQRMELMVRNAYLGLILVLLTLGLFLELRLAFWVTMGIPISFLGSVLFMPAFDVSINMITMFAFIVTLGMVVDDAIVVGENVFELRSKGVPPVEAAIRGAWGVAVPVTFAIATSVAAFMPLFFVPGFMGKIMSVLPTIVVSVLVISLFESLFILPAHVAHVREAPQKGLYAAFHRRQQRISQGLRTVVERLYAPFLHRVLRRRFLSLCVGIAVLLGAAGLVAGGRIGFRFMPHIDGDMVVASVELPFGASVEESRRIQKRVLGAAEELLEEHGRDDILRGVFAQIGALQPVVRGPVADSQASGGHLSNVAVFLVPSGEREISSAAFAELWRERVGPIAEAKSTAFSAELGPSAGAPVHVELAHQDPDLLEGAARDLAAALREYSGVFDVDDGVLLGKPQLDLKVTAESTSLGLSARALALQVRSAFYGAEALRQQEGRDEIRVMVRLPEAERRSLFDVEELLIRTPQGGEIPLREAAEIDTGRSWPTIERAEGRRVNHVKADVEESGAVTPGIVNDSLVAEILPKLQAEYPGLHYDLGGENREQRESLQSLANGFQLALLGIFALLAIPFRSYSQPVVVMAAIPFGAVGAILGHLIMGYDLSMISMMGIVALSGVVVNDSLVLIHAANRNRREGVGAYDAIHAAGVRRFRPILLTSLTTFLGLMPMILETSVQARFMIPMAISLGFGVMFATFVILLIVPALYLLLEDLRGLFGFATEPEA
jgi:multidrug efflux pump subunit AcrB